MLTFLQSLLVVFNLRDPQLLFLLHKLTDLGLDRRDLFIELFDLTAALFGLLSFKPSDVTDAGVNLVFNLSPFSSNDLDDLHLKQVNFRVEGINGSLVNSFNLFFFSVFIFFDELQLLNLFLKFPLLLVEVVTLIE